MYDVLNDWLCKGLLKNKTEVRLNANRLLFVYLNSVGLLEVVVSKKQSSKSSSKLKNTQNKGFIKPIFQLFSLLLPVPIPFNSFDLFFHHTFVAPFYPFDNLPLHFRSPISFFSFCLFIFSFLSKFMHFLYLCQRAPPPFTPPPDTHTHTNSTKTASPLATLARSQNEQAC